MGDVTLAAVAFEQQVFCAGGRKALRQVGTCAFKRAFAVDPHRAGKLLRGEEVMQMRKASGMRKVVRRAGNDADIGVAHGVVLF